MEKSKTKPLRPKVKKALSFGQAFKIVCAVEIKKAELTTASKSQRPHLENVIAELEANITPIKKQTAIDGRKQIVTKCLDYFNKYGAPDNITDFIGWLRNEVPTKSDTTVRNIVRGIFRIKRQKGRKPATSK